MKRIFFFINVFLAIALFASVGYNIVVKKDKDQPEYSVKKAGKKPAPAKPQTNYGIQTKKGDQETVIVKTEHRSVILPISLEFILNDTH